MTDARPAAVIVLAEAPPPALEPLLGPDGLARLHQVLVDRALTWAGAVGTPYLEPVPEGDRGTALAEVVERVHERHGGGPLLLLGVDAPHLTAQVGHEALEDLRSGTDVTFGPTSHGGFYLVGLHVPRPEVLALPADAWGGVRQLDLALRAAAGAGLSIAMLRSERTLEQPADVAAFLADPLTPPEVVAALRPPSA